MLSLDDWAAADARASGVWRWKDQREVGDARNQSLENRRELALWRSEEAKEHVCSGSIHNGCGNKAPED